MVEAGLQEVGTYVSCHQNTVVQFIATRPIIDLCLAVYCRLGSRVNKRWCDQDGLDMEGMRTAVCEADWTYMEE